MDPRYYKRLSQAYIALIVGTAFLATPAMAAKSVKDLVKIVRPAVVTIYTFDESGDSLSQGTGFLVSKDEVITNWHVIEGAFEAHVKTSDKKEIDVVDITAANATADLAKLKLAGKVIGGPLVLKSELPEVGEEILVMGAPLGLEFSVSDGIVSAVRELPGLGFVIQITAPISPGSSGSPVVNMRGEVIGVVKSLAEGGQNLNFAVAAQHVQELGVVKETVYEYDGLGKAKNDNSSEYYFGKGIDLVLEEKYEEALPLLKKAAERKPRYWEAWFQIGFCYGSIGEYKKAVEAYRKTISYNPDDPITWYNLGINLSMLGRLDEAEEAYLEALKLNPEHSLALYNLGVIYGDTDRHKESIETYKKSLKLNPDYPEAHFNMGVIYGRMKMYVKSADAYEESLLIRPDFADAHYNLGLTRLLLKDRDAAMEHYYILKDMKDPRASRLLEYIGPEKK